MPNNDYECYGIDDLNDSETLELLENDRSDSFLLKGLEKSIGQSDLESCESLENKSDNESDLGIPIRRFFHISVDQEKTTFTCLYGTFSYRRIPFGLCNAHATFKRCMAAIFHDMVEDFMEVFMDDFSVFGNSFDCCLANIDRMLARCEETNLVLKWEKYHFMVKERNVLGHKVYGAGIEADRAKSDVIAKLPYPLNIKGVTSFLGYAGFYLSDFNVGAVLGQRIDGKFKPIYYASKTMDNAQEHYTTTKKEIIAVVFSFDKMANQGLYGGYCFFKGLTSRLRIKTGQKTWLHENPGLRTFMEEEITDEFPDEHLIILKAELNNDEPCVSFTGREVYESGFFWPSIFKDAKDYVMRCDACQRSGNISSRSKMPQNNIQNHLQTCTGCTPFRLVYGKACHLHVEIEYRAYWAIKQCNMYLTVATKTRFMELNELMKLRDKAYESTRIYKERTKKWHESRLRGDKNFKVGDKVLLFNSRFNMYPDKLKSKWYGLNVVKTVYPYRTVEITDKNK
nr:transposon Ty3-I Gag-Pol polyprotein [Tanacetum cinerariifolium]